MQHELIFRGSLVEYWNLIYTEWQQPSRHDPLAQELFKLSHPVKDHPPGENETVAIVFLEEQHRREIVTVFADSVPDGKIVKLTVFFEDEAFEKTGESAVSKWNKMKNAWIRNNLLIDPNAQHLAKSKQGMQSETEHKLKRLREIRLERLEATGHAPTKVYAMSMADISYGTCKTHDPQLLKNWKVMSYE
jgi:hypothetical protein